MDHLLRAEADVRLIVGRDLDRLLRAAVAAAEASAGWGQGEEFYFEIDEPAFVEEGFELSGFVVRHLGGSYEITFYHGFASEFVQ
ncbi:MAG TPA: hypothetical protein VD866_17375 [Urbifossiella sp.]|nr:hypothetical protein [Urbifossiella sp.]